MRLRAGLPSLVQMRGEVTEDGMGTTRQGAYAASSGGVNGLAYARLTLTLDRGCTSQW